MLNNLPPEISTHTPHARRDVSCLLKHFSAFISTHTPHARRDEIFFANSSVLSTFQLTRLMRGVTVVQRDYDIAHFVISTHTPHARRDLFVCLLVRIFLKFQLTRLMRGVTISLTIFAGITIDFNSHASCEA